jgi:hypothetical protein
MKKILLALVIFIIACFVINTPKKDERDFKDIFQEEMDYAEFNTYVDPDMGCSFQYPSFFSKEDCDDGICNVRFGYHANYINMVMELKITYLKSSGNVYKDIISSGELKCYAGYCYHTHSITYRHCCYELTFLFPNDYKKSVIRIIRNINKWKPYKHRRYIF